MAETWTFDLINSPNLYTIKKLYKGESAKALARVLFDASKKEKDPNFFYKSGERAGEPKITNSNACETILEHWNYQIALEWTRAEIVKVDSYGRYIYEKYSHWKDAEQNYRKTVEIRETVQINNKYSWRMTPMNAYTEFVRIARMRGISEKERDKMIFEFGKNVVTNIDYQTARNDLIELILFQEKKDIFPTLFEVKGVDFFYNGIPYDQKVTFGLGEFQKRFSTKEEAFEAAKLNPKKVLEDLFEGQDFSRFNSNNPQNRLLFSITDLRVTPENIRLAIKKLDLDEPIEKDVFFSIDQVDSQIKLNIKSFFCQI